jgi:hypothetical protein
MVFSFRIREMRLENRVLSCWGTNMIKTLENMWRNTFLFVLVFIFKFYLFELYIIILFQCMVLAYIFVTCGKKEWVTVLTCKFLLVMPTQERVFKCDT